MRIIKLGIISIIVFATLIFLFSLMIPSEIRISRAVDIAAPKKIIAAHLQDVRTWDKWNEMIIQQDSGRGAFSQAGYKGPDLDMKMLSFSDDSVRTSWQHGGSPAIMSGFNMVQSLSDTTVTQWYFDFKLKWYPWEKFGSIVFDQQLGPAMEKSLNKLKSEIESRPLAQP